MGTYLHIVPADAVAMCLEPYIIVPTFFYIYYIRPGLRNNRDWNLMLHNIAQNMSPYSLTPNTSFCVLSTSIDKGFHYSQLCIIHTPQCSPASAPDEFFHEIFSQNTNIAFIGNSCPEAPVSAAELVHQWNISQFGHCTCTCIFSPFY